MRRWLVLAVLALVGFLALPTAPAAAHPLGNFSVNRYAGLTFHPDRVDAVVVADVAELPTLQDPSPSCAEAAGALAVTVAGERLSWAVSGASLTLADGAGGLKTSRLDCRLTAPVSLRGGPAAVTVDNGFRADRIGWRELTATGAGVRLSGSAVPSATISDELRRYPDDLLSSPPDVRTAAFSVVVDGSAAAAGAAPTAASGGTPLGLSGPLAGAERWLDSVVGGARLTPLVGLLAVLLALVLGAAHAALPGHGKTVMAAYLAGRAGRPRDAVAVGATVTLTHTGGVIALGLLLTTFAGIAGESVLAWLGVASGVLVAGIGVGALCSALRRRRSAGAGKAHGGGRGHTHQHPEGHSHDHDHGEAHAHSAEHDHGDQGDHDEHVPAHGPSHGHGHDGGHGHPHGHSHGGGQSHSHGPGRWGIAGIGVAGGLVPSPSALIVLLGAIALGRTAFGILLVFAYGLGMAATLTAAGLLLIRVRDRFAGRLRLLDRWRRAAPPATAALIVLVGLGLAGRAFSTIL